MKTIKEILLQEGLIKRQVGVDVKVKIEEWLNKYYITNYTINPDLTIDVNGNVNLRNYKEKQLPDYIQFGIVTEVFSCSENNVIESLKGAPKEVRGDFYCSNCKNLKSLEGCPEKVGGDFYCSYCTSLTSLNGSPEKVCRYFYCTGCSNLTSLEGAPREVGESFSCDWCGVKFTQEDVRKVCDVKGLIIV